MVLPTALMERFNEQLGFYACTVPNFEQYTLAHFIQEGFFEKHIARLRKQYRALRDALRDALMGLFPGGMLTIKEEEAGLHFLLHIQTDCSDEALKARALAQGIRISFLSDYTDAADAHLAHTAVLSYSGLRECDIPDVSRRLYTAWCT
jgi:GntR family transcriptional regulator/MocR family aminotransferase